jgi:hypothetical protein
MERNGSSMTNAPSSRVERDNTFEQVILEDSKRYPHDNELAKDSQQRKR